MKIVSLVIPAYCEEQVIEECYKRVKSVVCSLSSYDHELIFVDDGSTDNTLLLLKGLAARDEKLKILTLSRNFGHQIAITSGLDRARGDAVVVMDADLQDPPELIPKMLEKWEEGNKVVYAKRIARKAEGRFTFRRH